MKDQGAAVPPVNMGAEQALLGTLLLHNGVYDAVAAVVTAEDFALPAHQKLFQAIGRAIDRGQVATAVTLGSAVDDEKPGYLAELHGMALAPQTAVTFAIEIADYSLRRSMMDALGTALGDVSRPDPDRPASDILDEAAGRLTDLGLAAAKARGSGPRQISDIARTTVGLIETAMQRAAAGEMIGVGTGLAALDALLGGMEGGELIVIGARPSMGKTALAEHIAWSAARAGQPVQFFSFEMSADALFKREIARLTGLEVNRLRSGQLSGDEFAMVMDAERAVRDVPLWIDASTSPRPAPLGAQARLAKRKGRMALCIVDHLQKMSGDGKHENRRLEVGSITQALTRLAKQLDVPVILLSQLTRANEKREVRRPMMSDLRETGDIEQDADVVLLLHREHYYLTREELTQKVGEKNEDFSERQLDLLRKTRAAEGIAEINIAKYRQGANKVVRVGWQDERMRFFDLGGQQPAHSGSGGRW